MQLNALWKDRACTRLLTSRRRTRPVDQHEGHTRKAAFSQILKSCLKGFDPAVKKQLLMRLTLASFLLLGLCLHISANGRSQTVTYSAKKVTLKELFSVIEKQTGYVVFYDGTLLRRKTPVNIHAENMPLATFLNHILKAQSLGYSIQKKTIVISPGNAPEPLTIGSAEASIDVKGKLLNQDGQPASNVTVTVKGTGKATATDANGEFSLHNVDEHATLVFTSVAFETQELKLNGRTAITLTLQPKVSALGDVTVSVNTGYQKIPKERATGSYTVITSKDLERRTAPDLLTLLEGLAPGLLITKSANGIENQDDPSILMRGISTFGKQQPLIVVDGFPIEGTLNTINPNDIESVTLLRDAAAAAIWGVKASNGVIVITTKKGKTQAPKISVRSSVNVNERPDLSYLNLMSSRDLVDYEKSRFNLNPANLPKRNTGSLLRDGYTDVYAALLDFNEGKIDAEERDRRLAALESIDNTRETAREFLNANYTSDNTVSISAAPSDRFSYYASFGYLTGNGLFKGDNLKKSNVNFNTDIKLTNKLKLSIGANYTVQEQDISALKRFGGASNSDVPGSLRMLPYERLRNEDGSIRYIAHRYNNEINTKLLNAGFLDVRYSPLDFGNDYDFTRSINTLRLQTALTYTLNKSISFNVSYKNEKINSLYSDLYQSTSYQMRTLINDFANTVSGAPQFNIPKGGRLTELRGNTNNYFIRAQMDVNHTFNYDHRVDLVLGYERQKSTSDETKDTRFGFNPVNNINFPVNYQQLAGAGIRNPVLAINQQLDYNEYFGKQTLDDRYIFYYFAGSYAYKGKYTLSTSARINKSSRFDPSAGLNKQILASAGVKWDILKEDFIKAPSWMNLLQLRYTAGLTGNVPDITSSSLRTIGYTFASFTTNTTYLSVSSPANKNLRWEPTFTHNLALDFSVLSNRISGSIDFYHKKTADLLGNEAIDPTLTGFYLVPLNSSDITNKGFEVRLNTININTPKFRWQTTVNFGLNENKVGFSTTNKNSVIGAPRNLTGYAAQTFFALQWAGLDNKGNGQVWDVQHDGKRVAIPASNYQNLTFEDFVEIGSVVPKYTTGLSNILQYGNWDFSFLFVANGGHFLRTDIIRDNYFSNSFGGSGFTNLPQAIANRWRKAGDETSTNVPRLNSFNNNQYNWSDINYQSAAFIKLREVALAYLIDKKTLGNWPVNNIKLNFQVRNVWKWVKNDRGIDPEAYMLTRGERTLPLTATYTFGVLANF